MKNKFTRLYIAALISTFIFFCLASLFSWKAKDSAGALGDTWIRPLVESTADLEKVDETVELESNFQEVLIRAFQGNVEVRASADGKSRLTFRGYAPRKERDRAYGYKVKEGKLAIEDGGEGNRMMNFVLQWQDHDLEVRSGVNIELEVPEKQLREIQIKVVNGTVKLHHLQTKEIALKAVNGSMELRHVVAEKAQLKTVNGTIQVELAKIDKLEGGTVAGEILINADVKRVSVKSVSGDLRVGLPPNQNVHVDFSGVSGDLQNDYVLSAAAKKLEALKVEFKTVSGSCHLHTIEKTPGEEL